MEQQTSAERRRRAMILEAQGDAVSTVLRVKSAESMGERAIIEKGMETLEAIGEGESTTFVLPQELSSLVSRYGKHLTGSDLRVEDGQLDSLDFDQEIQEMLGLDNIAELIGEINEGAELDLEAMEREADAIKQGSDVESKSDNGIEVSKTEAEYEME